MTYYLSRREIGLASETATGFSMLVRDEGLLSSALAARPRAAFGGQDAYPDIWTKTAALIESLARNHALVDGNKRTSWAAGLLFLEINGNGPFVPDVDAAEEFVLRIAVGDYEDDITKAAEDLRRILSP